MLVRSDLPWAGGALDLLCIVLPAVSQIRERYAVALFAQLMICRVVICICSPCLHGKSPLTTSIF
jgi:hypothetical protein